LIWQFSSRKVSKFNNR